MTNPSTCIPGIQYFCDHRCWRCALTHRCAVFARWSRSPERQAAAAANPAGRVASALAVSLEVTMEEITVVAAATGAAPPVPEPAHDDEAAHAGEARLKEFVARDSLVARGAEYARGSWPVLHALRPILLDRGDAMAIDAADRLEETCVTVASKVFRAVSSSLDPDYDASDIQSDANGSAKVALLLIEESRRAWRVLMQTGRAAADGVPGRQVVALDVLETELLRRFPNALSFVRPGFDTGPAAGAQAQLAAALAAERPAGTV